MNIVVVGLGNPGAQYTFTRHNIGFMVVDMMADKFNLSFQKKKNYYVTQSNTLGSTICWVKPQTYMNLSVEAVMPIMQWLKLKPSHLIVIHDDIDLNFCVIRQKIGGGSGGHNGLKSIDQGIGNNYWRLRLGVGRPPMASMVSGYVLSTFDEEQMKLLPDFLFDASQKLEQLIQKVAIS